MSAAQTTFWGVPADLRSYARSSGPRQVADAYYTPDPLAAAIVDALHAVEPIRGPVWDPHAGGGAFTRQLLRYVDAREVWGSDINPAAPALVDGHLLRGNYSCREFLTHPGIHGLRWIIGNPPYAHAEQHVKHALTMYPGRHVVFLLRAAFVESKTRAPFWAQHPARHIWFLAKRPSFTGGSTDSCAYAVFWWDRQHRGPTTCTPGWDWERGRQ